MTIDNSSAAGVTFANANSLLSGTNTGTVSTTLTFTNGIASTGANTFVLGTTAAAGGLTYTAGGFTSGSTLGRYYLAAGTGTALTTTANTAGTSNAPPSLSNGSYPFVVGNPTTGMLPNHFHRATALITAAGRMNVTFNSGSGLSNLATPVTGAAGVTIDRKTNSNWVVTTSNGYATTATHAFCIQGAGSYTATSQNTCLLIDDAIQGTHAQGNNLPSAQRTVVPAASITAAAKTYTIGTPSSDVAIESVNSGNWEDPNTWGGQTITCASKVGIRSGHTVTVNGAAANCTNISVNGILLVTGNTLTVGCTDNNNYLNLSGTLAVSGGTLKVNGNISANVGSVFSQTGGDIVIDGNSGTVGTSVLTATPLVNLASNNVTLTGGKMTFVDGHIGTATTDRVLTYVPTSTPYPVVSTGHTTQFGDGVSTQAGSTKGFETTNGTRLAFGNVIVNTLASANNFVVMPATAVIYGDLTVTAGEFRCATTTQYVSGNILNNGTLTTAGILNTGLVTTANLATPTPTVNTNAQTIGGNGVFRNSTTTITANFVSLVVNNNNASGVTFTSPQSLLSGANTGTVSGTLTFTSGLVNTGSNTFVLGTAIAATGTLSYTAGGFATGSTFSRWWGTATGGATIAVLATATDVNAAPTPGLGSYPFAFVSTSSPLTLQQRVLNLNQTATGAGGRINVTYNANGSGINTLAIPITDATNVSIGAFSIQKQSNDSWTVTTTVTGTPTYNMVISAPSLYNIVNGKSFVTQASSTAAGTHVNGSTNPSGQRTAITLANLATTYYLGANGSDIPFQSIANGDFNDGNTWDKGGAVPSCNDAVIINAGTSVTVNNSSVCKSATVNTGGTLTQTGTLTVGCTDNSTFFNINGGTFDMQGGTLNVNGKFVLTANVSGIFKQSAGDIIVDGNSGSLTTSISGHVIDMYCHTTSTLQLTGGNFTVVDPTPTTTTGNGAFKVYPSVAHGTGPNWTLKLGDGISTTAGGNTDGFLLNLTNVNSFAINGTVIVNTLTGTNRHVKTFGAIPLNNLTITSGDYQAASLHYIKGNIINNGTMTTTTTVNLSDFSGAAASAGTAAQTISGSGIFRNSTTTSTAGFTSITVNNSNATGITLACPVSLSATLTLTSGFVNTSTANSLTVGTTTALGTISGGSMAAFINGPLVRNYPIRTASGTYSTTTIFPVGKTPDKYQPIWIDPTVTAATTFTAETFANNPGSVPAGVTNLAAARWEAIPANTSVMTNTFVQLGETSIVSGKQILQAISASDLYNATTSPIGFTAGMPSTIKTNSAITTANYTGFLSFGNLDPCPIPTEPTSFVSSIMTTTSFTGSFTPPTTVPTGYLVVRYTAAQVAAATAPVANTSYTAAQVALGGTIVAFTTNPTFNETGLTANTAYTYYIYSFNNTACYGPAYSTAFLSYVHTTCATVIAAPTALTYIPTLTSLNISWTASTTSGANYFVDIATNSTFTTMLSGYSNLNNGTALTLAASGLTPNTVYYVRVRAESAGCFSAASTTLSAITGYCASTSSGTTYYISNFVTTGGITNISNLSNAISAGGYGNFTAQSISASPSSVIGFTTTIVGGSTHGFAIYIDFNNDLDFLDTGEKVFSTTGYLASPISNSFTVPAGTPVGSYRMRIVQNLSSATPASCNAIASGETEDYTFNVEPNPSCIAPTGLTAIPTTSSATISWTASTTPPANGYEYFFSTSNTAPTAATTPSGAVNTGITTANIPGLTANTTYYYWVRSVCSGSDISLWSATGTFLTGYCASTSSGTTYYISNFVTTGGITNISNLSNAISAGGYGNFTAQSISASPSSVIGFTTTIVGGSTHGFAIYIDFNNDLDFLDTGEKVFSTTGYLASPISNSFTVPAGTPVGSYRMRIVQNLSSATPASCNAITSGETEDYTFVVPCASLSGIGMLAANTNNLSIMCGNSVNGYTYYGITSGGTNQYCLAIKWGANTTSKAYAEADPTRIAVFKNPTGAVTAGTPGTSGTATLGYYWNIALDAANQLTSPVSVRFYYIQSDLDALSTSVVATYGGTATAPVWFKTVGVPYSYSSSNVAATGQWMGMVAPTTTLSQDANGAKYAEMSGITSFSGGTVAVSSGVSSPLPITLKSFAATEKGAANVINWETAVETNVRNFMVEKSYDAKTWTQLGEEAPNATKRYSMIDNTPFATTYYRLKNVDNDGREDVSNIVVVNRKTGKFAITSVSPNPTTSDISLKFETTANTNVVISVIDIFGRVALTQQNEAQKGINTVTVNTSEIPSGTYFLQLYDGNYTILQRIIKQ